MIEFPVQKALNPPWAFFSGFFVLASDLLNYGGRSPLNSSKEFFIRDL